MRRIIGLGAGAHAKSVIDAIRSGGAFDPVALVDDDPGRSGSDVLGVPVLSSEVALARLRDEGIRDAFVGVGGTRDGEPRRRVFERLLQAGFALPPILHRAAIVSSSGRVGAGAQILAAAVVSTDAEIGDGAIVNTGAIVEHDGRVGAHAHIAPGARLAGLVTIGAEAHVGIGAVVIEGVQIGARAFVAAGAVVIRNVEDGARVGGVPARSLESRAGPGP